MSVYTLSPCISYDSNNYHFCNSRAEYNDHHHFYFPSYIFFGSQSLLPRAKPETKNKNRTRNIRILNMKIMMKIVMKNTKVSQDLLRQINNFMPLLHKTAEYNFHGNYHCSRVITYTISFKPSLQLPRS